MGAAKSVKSSQFEWSEQTETFCFLNKAWDVQAAKALIRGKPRKVVSLEVEATANLLSKRITREDGSRVITLGIHVDWEKVDTEEVDLSVPVILAPFQDSYIVIDGWHRVAKAHLKGIATLPAVVLTKKEGREVSR